MKIKKNFQGEIPANKIMGTYTESDTDTYNCNYINKITQIVYSTEEKIIGRWLDGRTLYEKTFYVSALPNTAEVLYNHNISNLRMVTDISGFAYKGNPDTGESFFEMNLPNVNPTNAPYSVSIGIQKHEAFSIGTGVDRSEWKAYVTLQYTKTTD